MTRTQELLAGALAMAALALGLAAPVPAWATETGAATTATQDEQAGAATTDPQGEKTPGEDAGKTGTVETMRLYNPYTGEHLYTLDVDERDDLVERGWEDEGSCWTTPTTSSTPVWRLYNSFNGEHLYTTDEGERDDLVELGWEDEDVAFYSEGSSGDAIFRLYNPYEEVGTHLYTGDVGEVSQLVNRGWKLDSRVCWRATADSVVSEGGSPIMGTSLVSAGQLAAYWHAVNEAYGFEYPSDVYAALGAPTLDDFCQILAEEAAAEGVRAEVVFTQAMKETNWLQFGGDVSAEQCNFAGIGATGGGAAGASFADVREGLRAQVQHLKAYASTDDLVNECVDPRFGLVRRGCAPYVEDLGGRWAVGADYGFSIVRSIDLLVSFALDR